MNCLFVLKGVPKKHKTLLETFDDIFHCPHHDPSGENIKTGTRCGIYSPVCVPELFQTFLQYIEEGKDASFDLYSNGESHSCDEGSSCNRETCGEELIGIMTAESIDNYYCLKYEFMEGPSYFMDDVIYLIDDGLKMRLRNVYYMMSGDYDKINNVAYTRIVELRPVKHFIED